MRRTAFAMMLLILLLFTAVVSADEASVGAPFFFEETFEDASDFSDWDGGIQDNGIFAGGEASCFVRNPYGMEIDGKISHMLSYLRTVTLEKGSVYRIKFDVMSLSSNAKGSVRSAVRFGTGADNIVFEFDNIPEEWTQVTALFMAARDADYSFSLELKNGDADLGFFVDDISIEQINFAPESLAIIGQEELIIPASGEERTRYTATAYTVDDEIINLLPDTYVMSAEGLPAGVAIDNESNSIIVSEGCPDGASFVLICTPPDYMQLNPASMEITLTKNVLKNSDFSQDTEYWNIDGEYELLGGSIGSYLSLATETLCPYGYSATIKPDRPIVLLEGVMYVFRAKVRVESGSGKSVYSQNTALSREGRVEINIIDLSDGDWTDVVAAFTPEASGVYDVNLSFVTTEPGRVHVGAMTLSPEAPDETYVTLHAPGNICIPDTETAYPLNAYVRDQAGEILGSKCEVEILPEGKGVEISGGNIVVSPKAVAGDYTIYACSRTNSSIQSSLTITISHDNIGDGGFEEKEENEWWAAAFPASLTIEEYINGRYARIVSENDYAIALNNSYMHLYAGLPYAFRADAIDGKDSVVTAFIETIDGENVPVMQAESSDGQMFKLFETDNDLVGRLELYITSEDGGAVDLGIDNVELFRSVLSVASLMVSGDAQVGGKLAVSFAFYNNLDPVNDPSACAISWYSTDSEGNDPIHIGSGEELSVTSSLAGKYVYVEVTPICALTGLSGAAERSVPLPIGSLQNYDEVFDYYETADETEEASCVFSPVSLSEAGESDFDDLRGHWAEKYVSALYAAGIVNGKTETLFCPDEKITRAEFAALICRAFGLADASSTFTDVPADAWYGGSVAALAELDIIKGTSETEFSPDAYLTREQMVSIFMRIYELMGKEAKNSRLSNFYDKNDVADWAEGYFEKALNIGLLNGTEQSTLLPAKNATRAEACTMLCKLLKILSEGQ